MVGGPHACGGVHAATAAPWPVSAARLTGRAWPAAGGLLTWGVGWPQADLVGRGCQKLGDEASRVRGGAVQAEGWGECQGDRENEPGEGQQSEGQPAGEPGLLNLGRGRDPGAGGEGSAAPNVCPSWLELLVSPLLTTAGPGHQGHQ